MEITIFLQVNIFKVLAFFSILFVIAPASANNAQQTDPSVIVLLNPSQIHITNGKNKTFLIDQSAFIQAGSNSNQEHIDKFFQPEGYSIEMELLTTDELSQQIQILFAARVGSATQSSGSNTLFKTDFVDERAFTYHKKYFRIIVPYEMAIAKTGIYLSVIGIELCENYNELKFNLNINEINHRNGNKRCPFDCLGSGKCNNSIGQCTCSTGYFDNDCSIKAVEITSVSRYSINNNTTNPMLKWETSFDSQSRQQFFYYQITKEAQGYLYFSLKQEEKSMEVIQEGEEKREIKSFQVFYKNDSFTLKEEQLNQSEAAEIFLEKIQQESNQSEDTPPILIGLRLNGQHSTDNLNQNWYIAGLIFSQSAPSFLSSGSQQFYFTSSLTVLILSVIVSILSMILLILLICLHRRMKKLDAAYQRAQSKKMIKEKQDQEVLSLIPILVFTQQLSDELKAKEGENNSEDPVCPVCLCDFSMGDTIRQTYCPHIFHRDCLELWVQKQKTCPHCRNSLSPRTLKEKGITHQNGNMNYHRLEEANEDKDNNNNNHLDGINDQSNQNNKVPLRMNSGLKQLQPPMAIPLRQIDSYMEHIDEDVHNISEVTPFPQKPTSPSEFNTNNTESIKFYKRGESEYPMADSSNYSRMDGAIELSQQSPDDVSMNKKYRLFKSANTSLDSNSPDKFKPGIVMRSISAKEDNFEIDMFDPQMKEQPDNENEVVQIGKQNDPNTETHICNFIINSERVQYSKNPSQIHSEICFGQNKEQQQPGEVIFPSNQTITTRERPHFKQQTNVSGGSFNSGVGSLRLIGQNENNTLHPRFFISKTEMNDRQESDQKS